MRARTGAAALKVVVVGDCGVDRFVDRGSDRPGGIGLNVAVHARRLCAPSDSVTVVAPLGDDPGAEVVRDAARRAGLETCFAARSGATPVQHIRHAPGGERIFVRFDEGVLAGYRVGLAGRDLIAASELLVTTAYGQALPLFASVMQTPSRGLRVVDFTNANDIGDPVAFVERHAGLFDVGFFGLSLRDGLLIDGLEQVARRSRRLFVVTLGADGSVALGGDERISQPAAPVASVVDTTGAGDTFTAAFACAYVRDRDVARAMDDGAEAAARTVQHLGGFELPPA